MKYINLISLIIMLLGPLFSDSVRAEGGHGWGHGGGGHFGGWHGGAHFGDWHGGGHFGYDLAFGLGYYGHGVHYYPYPYYPYPPVVAAPLPSPVYAQQNIPPTPEPQTNYWHYCRNPDGYYPYVRECPGDWEKISPQPPSQ